MHVPDFMWRLYNLGFGRFVLKIHLNRPTLALGDYETNQVNNE